MQSLLARIKAVRDQNAESNVVQRVDADGIRNNYTLNKFINQAELSDVENYCLQDGLKVNNIDDLAAEHNTLRTDDGLVIDIVMATNKVPGKSRNWSSSSSPRSIIKSRKIRGSRVSLNSVATSDRDDLDTLNLDSDDEVLTSRKFVDTYSSPSQAWAAFETCVKTIDNSSDYLSKRPKPNFVCSGAFQKVMVDMYGNTEYGSSKGYSVLKQKLNNMARSTMLASRMMQSAIERGQEERENDEYDKEHDCDIESQAIAEPRGSVSVESESGAKVAAKRGWKIVKRDVNETTMEQNTQSTKLNWTMLQHTLKQMSNVSKTRQDLYERYGILPTRLPDGSTVCENRMLSDRARAQLYGRNKDGSEYKRPMSYQPPSLHVRSRTQTGYQKKTRDGVKSAKLPILGRGKQRPVTAKP